MQSVLFQLKQAYTQSLTMGLTFTNAIDLSNPMLQEANKRFQKWKKQFDAETKLLQVEQMNKEDLTQAAEILRVAIKRDFELAAQNYAARPVGENFARLEHAMYAWQAVWSKPEDWVPVVEKTGITEWSRTICLKVKTEWESKRR